MSRILLRFFTACAYVLTHLRARFRCLFQSPFSRICLPLLFFHSLLGVSGLQARTELEIVDLGRDRGNPSARRALDLSGDGPAPLLVELLRWTTPDPARSVCEAEFPARAARIARTGIVSAPESPDALFSRLLDQSTQQSLDLDFPAVLESLKDARAALPCVSHVLPLDQLRTLFLRDAATHVYLKDTLSNQAFLDLLAVDPRPFIDDEYPPKVESAFRKALKQHTLSIPPLPLDANGVLGEALLDAQPVAQLHQLWPGVHLLQFRLKNGPLHTALIDIQDHTPSGQPVRLAPLIESQLVDAAEARLRLARALQQGRLEADQALALETYLSRTGQSRIVFAGAASSSKDVALWLFEIGRGLSPASSVLKAERPAMQSNRTPQSSSPPALVEPGGSPSRSPGFELHTRLGATQVFQSSGAVKGGLVDFSLSRKLGSSFLLSGFARFHYEQIAGLLYPGLMYGVTATLQLPLGGKLHLRPSLGYAAGKGPGVDAACQEDSSQTMVCTVGSQQTETSVATLLATHGHGPLARAELAFLPSGTLSRQRITLGLQAQYLFSAVHDGTLSREGEELAFTVLDERRSTGSLRVDFLLGVAWAL